jgi:tetratricopeptide (TPR) repeat protein
MEKAVKLDRSNGQFYKGKALFYSSTNKPKEAITALEECVRINPSNWACYNDLGANYFTIGKTKEVLEIMIKANSIAPDVISIQANLGSAYAINGEYQKSIAAFKKALSLSGRNDPIIELNLSFSYFKLQEYDMAWRHVRRAERMGNPNASEAIKELKRVSKEPG